MVNRQGRKNEDGHQSSGKRLSLETPARDYMEVGDEDSPVEDSLAATSSSRGAAREQPPIVQQRHGMHPRAVRDGDDNLPQNITAAVRHAAAVAELQ